MTATPLAAPVTLTEFDEYEDVILRVHTGRGSTPVVIVDGGRLRSDEEVGAAVKKLFAYLVRSEVYDAALERERVAAS